MAFLIAGQTKQFVIGAAFFPAGFAIIVVLGMELLTGNLGVIPTALFAGRVGWGAMLRNWGLVFVGNLAGSVIYAVLFWVATTSAGTNSGGIVGEQLRTAGRAQDDHLRGAGHARPWSRCSPRPCLPTGWSASAR